MGIFMAVMAPTDQLPFAVFMAQQTIDTVLELSDSLLLIDELSDNFLWVILVVKYTNLMTACCLK